MAVYEVVLRFDDREEVRLTDRPLRVGSTTEIAGTDWYVESHELGRETARYVCVHSHALTPAPRSRNLIGRSREPIDAIGE
jgi:hypothetical protein